MKQKCYHFKTYLKFWNRSRSWKTTSYIRTNPYLNMFLFPLLATLRDRRAYLSVNSRNNVTSEFLDIVHFCPIWQEYNGSKPSSFNEAALYFWREVGKWLLREQYGLSHKITILQKRKWLL